MIFTECMAFFGVCFAAILVCGSFIHVSISRSLFLGQVWSAGCESISHFVRMNQRYYSLLCSLVLSASRSNRGFYSIPAYPKDNVYLFLSISNSKANLQVRADPHLHSRRVRTKPASSISLTLNTCLPKRVISCTTS